MSFAAIWVPQVGEGLGEKGLIQEARFPALLGHALPEVSRLQRVVVSEHIGLAQYNDASLRQPNRLLYGCSIDQAETSRGWKKGRNSSFKLDPAMARKNAGFQTQCQVIVNKIIIHVESRHHDEIHQPRMMYYINSCCLL